MAQEIKVPAVGESITEVQIGEWYVEEGEWADEDKEIVGLETDKATFDVPAPVAGTISQVLKKAGEMAEVGEVIGYIEPGKRPASAEGKSAGEGGAAKEAPSKGATAKSTKSKPSAPEKASTTVPSATAGERVMPAAQRILNEHGLQASDVAATGPGGRITKEDVNRHLEQRKRSAPHETVAGSGWDNGQVVPMSPIRKRIAERLVEAQQTAALLTTFNEVDMSAVKQLREQYREPFQKAHGVKLGFMSFFVKAVVDALNTHPQVSAQIRESNLIYPSTFDIGVAVGGGKGLIVPVIRSAERLSFAEIELAIADFAERASKNKIGLSELDGGCFTISNGGIYGSLLSPPIVNPPQSGVLGMHGIFDRPVAVDGQVVIRPMMYIALTYDHRVVDGREAVTFLRRIKSTIEDPARMLLEI